MKSNFYNAQVMMIDDSPESIEIAANILKKVAPLANSDADKYAAEKEKADARFKEAVDYLEEAAKISPENANVKKMLPQVKAAMK